MTRKQALTELRDKVEAGAEVTARDASLIWPKGYAHAINAGHGSLDAALALHNAVLPGWTLDQMNEWHAHGKSAGWYVCLIRHSDPKIRSRGGDFDIPPPAHGSWPFFPPS